MSASLTSMRLPDKPASRFGAGGGTPGIVGKKLPQSVFTVPA
jgi:hypothetical protein